MLPILEKPQKHETMAETCFVAFSVAVIYFTFSIIIQHKLPLLSQKVIPELINKAGKLTIGLF